MNETRLDNSISDQEISLKGYSSVRKDRNRQSGGVAVFISSVIPFIYETELSDTNLEIIWLRVSPPVLKPFLLACVYRAPSTSLETFYSQFVDNIELEPWASKPARHYFEGWDMQRNE